MRVWMWIHAPGVQGPHAAWLHAHAHVWTHTTVDAVLCCACILYPAHGYPTHDLWANRKLALLCRLQSPNQSIKHEIEETIKTYNRVSIYLQRETCARGCYLWVLWCGEVDMVAPRWQACVWAGVVA